MSFTLSHGRSFDVGRIGVAGEDLPPYQQGAIDLRAWFGPDPAEMGKPLELEIGSGKGTFLLQQAVAVPGVNYIGIEWARQFWLYAADRMRRHGIANVRVLRTEAAFFIRNYVPDGCLRQVHIYFPDPWPKARHNKRRLVQAPFLRELWRVLQKGQGPTPGRAEGQVEQAEGAAPVGLVRLATDHSDYFAWMQEHAAQVADLFEVLPFESPAAAGEGELVGTNFERKYRREGRPFHAMILRKK